MPKLKNDDTWIKSFMLWMGVLLLSTILKFNRVLTRVKKSSVLTLQQEKTL